MELTRMLETFVLQRKKTAGQKLGRFLLPTLVSRAEALQSIRFRRLCGIALPLHDMDYWVRFL